MNRWFLGISFLFLSCVIDAQETDSFYDAGNIQEIRIVFGENNWKEILDSLFVHYGDEARLVGMVSINGTIVGNSGIRYKGFSSFNIDEIKNPINIDLDYVVEDQEYQGYNKIKLSNGIHDPSFVREVLAYEIAGKYLPSPRANFAKVFINGSYIGLYTNVESVNRDFLSRNFTMKEGAFFKGEPETMIYPFGQNSNLAYVHGTDTSGYLPYYKLESVSGWQELIRMIRLLDNPSDSLDQVLNIDRALWMHAFNYSLLNLDSYIGYAQNYYLYQDESGRFNPILWDLNMSFASFRESDGSNNFLGLTIPKIKVLDPLQHLKFSVSPRPLMKNLFRDDTLRRMYMAHIRTILRENILNGSCLERIRYYQSLIDSAVQSDTNRFYSYQDFITNADTTVGGVGSMILYPGLKDVMETRAAYLSGYPGYSGQPSIAEVQVSPEYPVKDELITIRAYIAGASEAFLAYRFNDPGMFTTITMHDDGTSGDGEPGDKVYGATIPLSGEFLQYYIYAQNDSAGVFSPERAAYEFYQQEQAVHTGDIVINEIRITPETLSGASGDLTGNWAELLNTGSRMLNLAGCSIQSGNDPYFITDLPDKQLEPGEFLLIPLENDWSDHAAKDVTYITLLNQRGATVDSIPSNWYSDANTYGRFPDGSGSLTVMEPTPGDHNQSGSALLSGFRIYPNPAHDQVFVEMVNTFEPFTLRVFNLNGQCLVEEAFAAAAANQATLPIPVSLGNRQGVFLVCISSSGKTETGKLVLF